MKSLPSVPFTRKKILGHFGRISFKRPACRANCGSEAVAGTTVPWDASVVSTGSWGEEPGNIHLWVSFRFGRGPMFSQYPASCTVTGMFKKDPKLKSVTWANIAFTYNALLPTYGHSLPGWNVLLTDRLSFSYRYGGRFGGLNFPEISGIISFCNFSTSLAMNNHSLQCFCACPETILTLYRNDLRTLRSFLIWIAEPFWKGTVGIALHLTVAVELYKASNMTPFIKMCGADSMIGSGSAPNLPNCSKTPKVT